jgi:two-component system sensor histidine kinase KdpD
LDDRRPDPDSLIAAAAAEGKGRLKIFLGAAPGVGKTWEMLTAAQARKAEGADVLIGIVETHGRAGTESQIGDLPLLPRKSVEYRGQALEEFDLDAALARRPKLILIDELAHTNAPGSRHAKRWEDVETLLDLGIDVWATLNVQHLESLNDSVARITGVRVTETLPDRVLEMADEIELIDLPPAELQARLRDGRIYRPDVAKRALDGFFRQGNLAALREIALRRVAEHVDTDVRDYMRQHAISGPWPARERVLALIGAEGTAGAVVRQAKRLADALHAPWIALHVERGANPMALVAPLELAGQLGAEVDVRAGPDLVAVVLEAAARHNATHIVIGRARPKLWRRVLGRTLASQLLKRAPDLALHVVPLSDAKARPPAIELPPWWSWVAATLLVAAITGAAVPMPDVVPPGSMGMVYLAAVVTAGSFAGLQVALWTAALGFLAWDFFFLPPIHRFTIGSMDDLIALAVFAVVAVLSGSLSSRVRAAARSGQARIESLRRIAQFSRRLGEPTTEPEMMAEIARQGAGILGRAVVLAREGEDLFIRGSEPPTDTLDEASWAAARWCATHNEPAGRGTGTLPSAVWRFLPMRTVRGQWGVLGARAVPDRPLDATIVQTLSALADQAGTALERVRLANDAARSAAMDETQKLRTALLNSLSHDLRTPLTGIRGAAETLQMGGDTMKAADRRDLLESIQEDTGRMTKFLANIMDLTRLESGAIQPRLAATPLPELIDAAAARVPGLETLAVDLPAGLPAARADAALLEQVLVNVLDNAHRYAPAGSLVRISARASLGRITIEVADEGVGIPAADLPHVFDSFYRARRGDRVAPGTGLGLAIARGLMAAMDGTIEAISPRPDAPRDGSPGTLIQMTIGAA